MVGVGNVCLVTSTSRFRTKKCLTSRCFLSLGLSIGVDVGNHQICIVCFLMFPVYFPINQFL